MYRIINIIVLLGQSQPYASAIRTYQKTLSSLCETKGVATNNSITQIKGGSPGPNKRIEVWIILKGITDKEGG